MVTNTVEMQGLKVNMVRPTMETSFHKINCLQYIYAMIIKQVVLLNV